MFGMQRDRVAINYAGARLGSKVRWAHLRTAPYGVFGSAEIEKVLEGIAGKGSRGTEGGC